MAKKKGFLDSRGFKLFMKYLYGIGAAVVIGGALFKIMHWPYANEMLIAGMGTEVVVFFVSAFEPLHEELDWARVYPQLAEDSDPDWVIGVGDKEDMSAEEAMAIADAGMKDIELSPELFESLSGSLEGLKNNVDQLSNIEDATVATNEYASSVRNATGKMGELNSGYENTVSAMNSLSTSVGGAAEQAHAYHEEVQKVTKNLASLNAVYEMELNDAQQHISTINKFYESLGGAMTNMVEASKDAESYRNEVATLTQNIRDLNGIYGGMLSAMSGNRQG
ncbi:MAG TPA: gliding motility protein GldL [Bacteroidetes bacterium]|nr:gliding motility protein GldL [Bacteroidota bacterium]